MTDTVEISCDAASASPGRRVVRLNSADFQRQALLIDVHSVRQAAKNTGATPVDWIFTPRDAEELAVELKLSPDASLEDCVLDDLPISIREDAAGSGLRAVRGVAVLHFPLSSFSGPVRIL